ncbi:MAG: hypothetical protein IJ693_02055, partial [Bacteroidaceae bacterium]|nr:hypothetical protein [Bacteroidaceae bacterium]
PLEPNAFVKDTIQDTEEDFMPITKKEHVLQNVTVKAKRRYFTNDDWRYKNEAWGRRWATLYYNIDRELDNILDQGLPEPTIFEFLCKKNASFNNPKCINLPAPGGSVTGNSPNWRGEMSYNNRNIQWIVNNGEKLMTGQGFAKGDLFFPTWMNEIKHLYIVPYDLHDENGTVKIYIYTHKRFTTESQKGLRRTYFQGFNTPSTFKMEDYSIIPPMADFRRTIYWNPDIKTDKEGKAKVEFFNNSTCEEMYISTEGMTNDGKILVNE